MTRFQKKCNNLKKINYKLILTSSSPSVRYFATVCPNILILMDVYEK